MREQQIDVVLNRISRLEREVCWWRRLGALCLAVVTGILLMGQTLSRQRVVEAEKFILKGPDGSIRAIFGATIPHQHAPDAATATMTLSVTAWDAFGLHVYGADGKYRAGMYEWPGGGGGNLTLADEKTPSQAHLTVGSGLAALNLSATEQTYEAAEREDAKWDKRLNAAKTPEEREKLRATKPFDGVSAGLGAFAQGTSSLYAIRGSPRHPQSGLLTYLVDGKTSLALVDENGTTRVTLGHTKLETRRTGKITERPVGSLLLFNKQGNVIWQAP